jgi:dynein heavy chain, axonemal
MQVIEHIKAMPENPPTELFGFHPNAEITKNLKESKECINSLLLIGDSIFQGSKSKVASGVKKEVIKSDNKIIEEMCNDILAKLPDKIDMEAASKKYAVAYEESINSVLLQELARFNILLQMIKSSLRSILLAQKGLELMSPDIEKVCNSLLLNQIPELWMKKSYPSLKPVGSYINDLKMRITYFQQWVDNGQPQLIWLAGIFFTQSYLTALLQNYARKNKIEIDALTFDFQFLAFDDTNYSAQLLDRNSCPYKSPADGAYITGLYLEGCKWDLNTKQIEEADNKVLFSPMPIIWLIPKRTSEIKQYQHYECPIYKTTERKGTLSTTGHSTNFIMYVRLPTKKNSNHWVKRGVALICQLSD